jgi:hypothetical protein
MSMLIKKSGVYVIAAFMISLFVAQNCKKKTIAIKISHDRVTESIPGNRVSAAYMDIVNTSEKDDVLVSIDCDAFETVEMHNMYDEDGVMKMEPMDSVAIKAGQTVNFSPGTMHVMLINNKKEIKAGEKVELNLHFEKAGIVKLTSPVKSIQEQVE